jgi:hypothetical protein
MIPPVFEEAPVRKTLISILLLSGVFAAGTLAQEQPPTPRGSTQAAHPPPAVKAGIKDRMFFGGGIGFGFGDVDWVEVSPMVGFKVLPKLSTGIGLTYRHRKDSRYDPDLSTSDYGGDVFAQYTVFQNVFAMVEYEYLSYEYYPGSQGTTRTGYNSVLVGGGVFQPMGEHSALVLSGLYNLSYSDNEASPYGSPWVLGAGVSVGF